jgi:hypothetical protein
VTYFTTPAVSGLFDIEWYNGLQILKDLVENGRCIIINVLSWHFYGEAEEKHE